MFEARGLQDGGQPTFTLSFDDRPGLGSYPLWFQSRYFDPLEFEVDRVENAGPVGTRYHTEAHPNRLAELPPETLSLASVYEQAGFKAEQSPESGSIPLVDAGADGSWSDNQQGAKRVMQSALETMEQRAVLPSVIRRTEDRLGQL